MLPAGDKGHPCNQLAASSVLYTTSCKHTPEDGRNYRPKYVELIEIISKSIIVTFSWLCMLLHQ